MKYTCKSILLSIFVSILGLSPAHASINDSIYSIVVIAPHAIYVPTFEFEAGNSLLVIGASYEYGELTGIWQEAPLGNFSYFQAQVVKSETTTTTTTPATTTTPSVLGAQLNSSALQLTQSEKTKFLINLAGFSFVPPELPNFNMLIGIGAYLGAEVIFVGFSATSDEPAFGSISLIEGIQEQSYTDIEISCKNTTFQDDPPVSIQFNPPDGLTVSNISVTSNTTVEFDLKIDVDAPTGFKSITVTYGEPPTSVVGDAKFEVKAQ